MDKWFDEAETHAAPGAALYLTGAKADKASNDDNNNDSGNGGGGGGGGSGGSGTRSSVSPAEGAALAEAHGAGFCEVSAKTGENVRTPFVEIVDRIVNNPDLLAAVASGSGRGGGTVKLEKEGYSACPC